MWTDYSCKVYANFIRLQGVSHVIALQNQAAMTRVAT